MSLDPHEKPPSYLRDIFKQFKNKRVNDNEHVVYDTRLLDGCKGITSRDWRAVNDLNSAYTTFIGDQLSYCNASAKAFKQAFTIDELPGKSHARIA